MYKIYTFSEGDRSYKIRWCLAELGQTYELCHIDGEKREFFTADYVNNIHPTGMVPVLFDDNKRLFESSAILFYLAEKHSESRLLPDSVYARGLVQQWCYFSSATLEPLLENLITLSGELSTDLQRVREESEDGIERALIALERQIKNQDFLVENTFSIADIAVGYPLRWRGVRRHLHRFPALSVYKQRLSNRVAASQVKFYENESPL